MSEEGREAMRILLIFVSAFCCACAAVLLFLPALPAMLAVPLLLAAAIVLVILRGREELRLVLILAGLAAGLVWGEAYDSMICAPIETLYGETLEISGLAADYSTDTDYGIRVEALIDCGDRSGIRADVWLYTDEQLSPGDTFTVIATLENPSDDDYYAASDGIYLYAYGKGEAEISRADAVPLRFLPRLAAHHLEEILMEAVPEDAVGFALALSTGNRSMLTNVQIMRLKNSGIYHALALSGMHMAVLTGILCFFIRKRKLRCMIGIPLIVAFVLITGAPASLVRAGIMQCLLLLAPLFNRETDPPTSLAFALFLMMLQNPWCLMSWGLQLSFLATLGISLFGDRFFRLLKGGKSRSRHKILRKNKKLRNGLAALLSATFSAQIFTIPLMVVYFGYLSLVSPLTNLLTGWIISALFAGSLLVALVGLLFMPLASLMGWMLAWPIRYVSLISRLMASLPFCIAYHDGIWGIALLLAVYCLILLTAMGKIKRKWMTILSLGAVYAVFVVGMLLGSLRSSFTAVDVGQGQSLIFHQGGAAAVIDCGGSDAGCRTCSRLIASGVTHLDTLILTHFDSDHTDGFSDLAQCISIGKLLIPDIEDEGRGEIEEIAEQYEIPVIALSGDSDLSLGSGSLRIYVPPAGASGNNGSLAALYQTKENAFSVLVTGDMDFEGENSLLSRVDIPDVDVLVAGHHGSKTSTSTALLAASRPETVVISVGYNSYGHPAEETLNRIAESGAQIFRTDEEGSIILP